MLALPAILRQFANEWLLHSVCKKRLTMSYFSYPHRDFMEDEDEKKLRLFKDSDRLLLLFKCESVSCTLSNSYGTLIRHAQFYMLIRWLSIDFTSTDHRYRHVAYNPLMKLSWNIALRLVVVLLHDTFIKKVGFCFYFF